MSKKAIRSATQLLSVRGIVLVMREWGNNPAMCGPMASKESVRVPWYNVLAFFMSAVMPAVLSQVGS